MGTPPHKQTKTASCMPSAPSLVSHKSFLIQFGFRRIFRRSLGSSGLWNADQSASAKLFADAAVEEAEDTPARRPSSRLTRLEGEYENWTGEESMEDAVLRMLVDKYKPLRSGTIRTAEEKIRQAPPIVHLQTASTAPREIANEPLLPAVEGHKPWLTTFKAPSHATASIRLGNFSSVSARTPAAAVDERARKKEKEVKKRTEQAGRLTRARESTLDYRLGIRGEGGSQQGRPNPVSLRGWTSLIEDKIEKSRKAGHFITVKGRGQPLVRQTDEGNPFIAREEFLMNRIVQRNGAAPPWVEVQGELESAVNSFREILRQSWIRRAIRTLTISQPAALLPSLTLAHVTSLRDIEWEDRERSYHDTALDDVNSLVRKYNGLAPYAVRRPYYMRDVELEKMYTESGEDILRGISERLQEPTGLGFRTKEVQHEEGDVNTGPVDQGPTLRIRDVIRTWLSQLSGRR